MEFFVDFLESWIGYVRVNLGRGNRRMSQKLLDGADVGTVGKQRGSEGVTQRMGGNVLYDARLKRPPGDHGRNEIP